MVAVERDDARHLSESHIESMIRNTAEHAEVDSIRKGISLLLNKTISVAYIKDPELDNSRVFRAYYMSKQLRDKLILAKYEDGFFILITTSKWDTVSHRLILEEACQSLSLPVDSSELILYVVILPLAGSAELQSCAKKYMSKLAGYNERTGWCKK